MTRLFLSPFLWLQQELSEGKGLISSVICLPGSHWCLRHSSLSLGPKPHTRSLTLGSLLTRSQTCPVFRNVVGFIRWIILSLGSLFWSILFQPLHPALAWRELNYDSTKALKTKLQCFSWTVFKTTSNHACISAWKVLKVILTVKIDIQKNKRGKSTEGIPKRKKRTKEGECSKNYSS